MQHGHGEVGLAGEYAARGQGTIGRFPRIVNSGKPEEVAALDPDSVRLLGVVVPFVGPVAGHNAPFTFHQPPQDRVDFQCLDPRVDGLRAASVPGCGLQAPFQCPEPPGRSIRQNHRNLLAGCYVVPRRVISRDLTNTEKLDDL